MALRVIIAGGGTGGHIFPAVAIGHALQRLAPATELLFVGAEGKMEMEKVPQEGFRIIGLPIAGFNRTHLWKNFGLPWKMIKSGFKARRIMREFAPQVVIGVGGFASYPMLNTAQQFGIPTLIQEQNSFAGRANKLLSRNAFAACVAYEGMEAFFPKGILHLTGNPVRKAITGASMDPVSGKAAFGIPASEKVLLIVGGSLGARSINEAVGAGLQALTHAGYRVIWQTGKPYFESAKEQAAAFGDRVVVADFIRNMQDAYAAADVVISRAGALAIAELCIVAKPVVFVPYPFAAEDHQTSNAMALVRNDAAMLVTDAAAKDELIPALLSLGADATRCQTMSAALSQMAIRDADERIAREVLRLAGLGAQPGEQNSNSVISQS
jgi:UDP-N-acetylglucosamine--N-acetylmuramyl-(pentapeptide) pyrophosphoryl-undecaprenol N-acetylglucosamine transferase